MDKKVLVAEDNLEIREFVNLYLTKDGYHVIEVERGDQVLEVFQQEEPDLVLLDIIMPGMDGIEVCREIRKISVVPIIFLSNKIDEIDKIIGLSIGADDYITKPFSPRELTARIRAHIRRQAYYSVKEESNTLQFSNLKIDLLRHTVTCNGKNIELSTKEFGLLSCMAKHPGRIFTVEELFELVWGEFSLGDTRTVIVHISGLRKKLEENPSEPKLILTIRGTGYKFSDNKEGFKGDINQHKNGEKLTYKK